MNDQNQKIKFTIEPLNFSHILILDTSVSDELDWQQNDRKIQFECQSMQCN